MTKTSFYEIQFPTDIAYGSSGGPEFFTEIITSSSGFEQRNSNCKLARNRYNLAPSIKNRQQLEYLIGFFRLCLGRAIGFRFKDWADYQLENQYIATADGNTCEFQLVKGYNYAGYEVIRKIIKPVEGKVKIYINNKEVFPKIEPNTGLIKFLKPPKKGEVISADAEFDVPVRFDTDHLSALIENHAVYSHHEIPLLEIKL